MHKNSKIIQKALDSNLGDMYESFSKNMAEKTLGHIDARKANIASRLLEKKVVCPKCKGDGCDHCDDKGYHLNEASQRFGGDTNIPASPEIKKHIESGKAKILINVQSASHPSARFLVIKNPKLGDDFGNTRANQDKVLMAITSDPKRGRIKMFSYHGTHVSHQKAMDFAKKHKLVATKDANGRPLYAKESVELDEVGYMGHRPRVGGNRRTGMTRAKQLEMEKRKRERARANAKRLRGESVELHEITKIYKAKSRAEYQKLYGAASDAMYDKMLGRGGMVGDRSKLTVKMKFKDEKSRKKFERMNKSLIGESVEVDEVKISRNPQLRIGLGKGRPAGQRPAKIEKTKFSDKPICIIIGPEGDFSEHERQEILSFKGVQALKINDNILRSETAVISAISIINYVIN